MCLQFSLHSQQRFLSDSNGDLILWLDFLLLLASHAHAGLAEEYLDLTLPFVHYDSAQQLSQQLDYSTRSRQTCCAVCAVNTVMSTMMGLDRRALTPLWGR